MRSTLSVLLVGFSTLAYAQESPYAGEERRSIKSLSQKEIDDYLTGAGMGYAKVAELHHYPGPRHVIDLAEKLGLTKEQLRKVHEIFTAMKEQAVLLGKKIVEEERELDRLFAEQTITKEQIQAATGRIATLQGQLRSVHLAAHLSTKEILRPAQIEQYDILRGYGSSTQSKSQKQQHNH